jgi:hypothetical protein
LEELLMEEKREREVPIGFGEGEEMKFCFFAISPPHTFNILT